MNWGLFLGRIVPLYLLVAIPVAFLGPMLLGMDFLVVGFFINWGWIYLLLRYFKP